MLVFVCVKYKGEKLANMKELTGNISKVGSVTLNSYEPQLLEYDLKTAEIEILDVKDKYVQASVKNNTEDVLKAKILFEILDVNGNVIGYGYSKTSIAPDKNHKIDIRISCKGTADYVRVTVYDDAGVRMSQKLEEM